MILFERGLLRPEVSLSAELHYSSRRGREAAANGCDNGSQKAKHPSTPLVSTANGSLLIGEPWSCEARGSCKLSFLLPPKKISLYLLVSKL